LLISEILLFTSLKYHGIVKSILNCCKRNKRKDQNDQNDQNENLLNEKELYYDSDTEYSLYTDIESVKQKLNIIIDKIEEIKETQDNQEIENQKINK